MGVSLMGKNEWSANMHIHVSLAQLIQMISLSTDDHRNVGVRNSRVVLELLAKPTIKYYQLATNNSVKHLYVWFDNSTGLLHYHDPKSFSHMNFIKTKSMAYY